MAVHGKPFKRGDNGTEELAGALRLYERRPGAIGELEAFKRLGSLARPLLASQAHGSRRRPLRHR